MRLFHCNLPAHAGVILSLEEESDDEVYNLPAHAGVIPIRVGLTCALFKPTRTRGGDPPLHLTPLAYLITYPHTRG